MNKELNQYITALITEGPHKGERMHLGTRIPLPNGVVICNGKTEGGEPIGITSDKLTDFSL